MPRLSLMCRYFALTLPLILAAWQSYAQSVRSGDALVAGSFLLRGRVVGILPQEGSSPITPIGGYINTSASITPEIDLSYFLTNHIAVEGEAGILHTTLTAEDTALGKVPIGKISGVPIIFIPQYHFLPFSRVNPYVGVGLAILPYFDPRPDGGLVHQLSVTSEVGAAFQLGADYRITGRWFGNVDVKKLILGAQASANNGDLTSQGQINPWIVGVGIGYRF